MPQPPFLSRLVPFTELAADSAELPESYSPTLSGFVSLDSKKTGGRLTVSAAILSEMPWVLQICPGSLEPC